MYNRDISYHPRARKKRKINKKRLLLSLMFLCIISVMPLAYGSFFAIDNIEVMGNKSISDKEILKTVEYYYNKNLLSVKSGAVKDMVQETLPIEDVKIKYKLPRTLILKVKERDIAAAIHYLNGFALIDKQGIIVKLENKLDNYSIPIVTGLNVVEADVAKRPTIDKDEDCFQKLLELIERLSTISPELSEINTVIDEHDETIFYLYTLDGYQVFLGNGDDEKIAILNDLLADVRNKNLGKGLLDVSYNMPIFKPFVKTSEEGS